MNARVEPLRAGLAILTTLGLVIAMMMVVSGPAGAVLVDGAQTCDDAGFPEGNKVEGGGTISNGWGSASWDDDEDFTLEVDMNEGWSVEICVKAGEDGVHVFTVTEDTTLGPFGDKNNGISHASWRNASQTTTTTTVADTTTTTVAATTSTTVAATTSTTVAATTSITAQVAGTVITTAPTTTVAAEVQGTTVEAEQLPFTGIESDRLVGLGVFLLASGLVALGITGRREEA